MGNFSDYINSTNINKTTSGESRKEIKECSYENLEKLIDKYSSLDDDILMKEFLKMTIERKKQGNLSESELEILKSTILPYLNDKQKESLEKILEIVRNVWKDW